MKKQIRFLLFVLVISQLPTTGQTSSLYYTAGTFSVGSRHVYSLLQYSSDNLVIGMDLGEIDFYNLDTYSVIGPISFPTSGGPPVYSLTKLNDMRIGSSGTVKDDLRMRAFDSYGNLDKTYDINIPRTLIQLSDERMVSEAVVGSINGYDNAIIIWELDESSILKLLKGHTDRVSALVELNDGSVAAASKDGNIYVWNATDSLIVLSPDFVFTGHNAAVKDLILLDSGNLASCAGDEIIIWDYPSGSILKRLSSGRSTDINKLLQLSDMNILAGSNVIDIWDYDQGQILDTLYGENNSVNAIVELTDGRLVTAGLDTKVILWKKGNLWV
jgi:WD40 repeat protein